MKLFDDALATSSKEEATRKILSCDPARHAELKACALAELERLKKEPPIRDYRSPEAKRRLHQEWVAYAVQVLTADLDTPPKIGSQLLDILEEEAVAEHLAARPPSWLQSAIEKALSELHWMSRDHLIFGVLHPYIVRGMIPTPEEGHDYYQLFLTSCHKRAEFAEERIVAHLTRFPQIIEIILPRAFRSLIEKNNPGYLLEGEVEWRDGSQVFENKDDRSIHARPIPTGQHLVTPLARALDELAANGDISRTEILRTVLESIADSSRELETRELKRFHNFFIGDPSETALLFESYISLLSSPFVPVVKFAVEHLETLLPILPKEQLDQLPNEIPPALTHTKSKPLIEATAQLLCKLVELNPDLYAESVEHIAPVLALPAPKIQKQVLTLLKLGNTQERAEILPFLEPYQKHITGKLKKSFEPWFATPTKSTPPAAQNREPSQTFTPPRGESVKTLTEVDDLVFVANELLSKSPDPLLLEQLMDGFSALSPELRPALAERLTPFQKRALKKFDNRHTYELPCWIDRLAAEFIVRIGPEPDAGEQSWINLVQAGDQQGDDKYYHGAPGAIRFLIRRLLEILEPGRPAHPLLGSPETDLGFISFSTLLARVNDHLNAAHPIGHCDFLQAIARCDVRSTSPTTSETKAQEPLRVLHFLATGEIIGKVETATWWITAGRIREPRHDYSDQAELGSFANETRPDWLQPARYRAMIREDSRYFQWRSDLLDDSYAPNWQVPSDAVLSLRFGETFDRSDCVTNCDADLRWLFSLAPGHLDPIIGQALTITQSATELTPAPLRTAIPVIYEEFIRRRPALSAPMRYHLLYNLSTDLKPCREATPELWLQAEEDGRLAPAIPDLADDFWHALHAFDWSDSDAYVPLAIFDLTRVNVGLHAIRDLHPNLPLRLRDMLLTAFSKGLRFSPRSLSKTFDLLHALVIDHPPTQASDLALLLSSPLATKDLRAAKLLVKALE